MNKKIKKISIYFFIFIFLIISIFPIYFLFVVSTLSWSEFRYSSTPIFLPNLENLSPIIAAFLSKEYANSLIISSIVTIISIFFGMLAGYSFARYRIGGFYLPFTLLSIRMLPVVAFIIPLFMFSLKLRIIDTHLAIILSHLIICLPFAIWMMRAFFIDLPFQIEEAALVDGCTKWQIFIKIAIPLTLPGIAVTGLFCFIFSWSEFIFSLVLSRKEAIPINVRLTGGNNALAVASIIPVFLLSVIINKNIVRGMTLGAIK